MFHRPTFRSQVALLIAMLVAVQSVGTGFAAQCRDAVSCCAASEGDSQSCCDEGDRLDADDCCCGSSMGTQCSTLCSCNVNGPSPARPCESQSSDGLQQLLDYGFSQSAIQCSATLNQRYNVAKHSVLPAAKAGVHSILCVWLT